MGKGGKGKGGLNKGASKGGLKSKGSGKKGMGKGKPSKHGNGKGKGKGKGGSAGKGSDSRDDAKQTRKVLRDLTQEVFDQHSVGDETNGSVEGGHQAGRQRPGDRKKQRKQQRLEKKQRKNDHQFANASGSRSTGPTAESDDGEEESQASEEEDGEQETNSDAESEAEEKSADVAGADQDEDDAINDDDPDAEELRYLEEKLGLSSSKGKQKLMKEMLEDGFDDDLMSLCDDIIAKPQKKRKASEEAAGSSSTRRGRSLADLETEMQERRAAARSAARAPGAGTDEKDGGESSASTSDDDKPLVVEGGKAKVKPEKAGNGNEATCSQENGESDEESNDSERSAKYDAALGTVNASSLAGTDGLLYTADELEELKYLEKQLGIGGSDEQSAKKKRKLGKELALDGIDTDLLGLCDKIVFSAKDKKRKCMKSHSALAVEKAPTPSPSPGNSSSSHQSKAAERAATEPASGTTSARPSASSASAPSEAEPGVSWAEDYGEGKPPYAMMGGDDEEESSDEGEGGEIDWDNLTDEDIQALCLQLGMSEGELLGEEEDSESIEDGDELGAILGSKKSAKQKDSSEAEAEAEASTSSELEGEVGRDDISSDSDSEEEGELDERPEGGPPIDLEQVMKERGHLLNDADTSLVPVAEKEKERESGAPPCTSEGVQFGNKPVGAWLPPHLRKKAAAKGGAGESAATVEVSNKLQGLLNRLSEGNLDGIATDVCKELKEALNHSITTACGADSTMSRAKLLDAFAGSIVRNACENPHMSVLVVACYAAIVVAAGGVVGQRCLTSVVAVLEQEFKAYCEGSGSVSRDRAKSVSVLTSLLFHFGVLPGRAVFNMFRKLMQPFEDGGTGKGGKPPPTPGTDQKFESAVEVALGILRYSGKSLRACFPADFKQVLGFLLELPCFEKTKENGFVDTDSGAAGGAAVAGTRGSKPPTTKELVERMKHKALSTSAGASSSAGGAASARGPPAAAPASAASADGMSRLEFFRQELWELQAGKKGGFKVMERFQQTQMWLDTCGLLHPDKRTSLAPGVLQLPHDFLFEEPKWGEEEMNAARVTGETAAVPAEKRRAEAIENTTGAPERKRQKKGIKTAFPTVDATDLSAEDAKRHQELLQAAVDQRLPTEAKRSVFVALQGAEDDQHAVLRLNELKLPPKQRFRDVAEVLVHCALRDSAENPFYPLVMFSLCAGGQGQCAQGRKYRDAFRNAVIPRLQEVHKYQARPLQNLAFLFAAAVSEESVGVPLAHLRFLDFSGVSQGSLHSADLFLAGAHGRFLKTVVGKLLEFCEEADWDRVLLPLKQYSDVRDGVVVVLKKARLGSTHGKGVVDKAVKKLMGGEDR